MISIEGQAYRFSVGVAHSPVTRRLPSVSLTYTVSAVRQVEFLAH